MCDLLAADGVLMQGFPQLQCREAQSDGVAEGGEPRAPLFIQAFGFREPDTQ